MLSGFDENIKPRLDRTPYIRLPLDTIPEQRILVYKYLTDDFLNIAKKAIPIRAKRRIIRDSLRGKLLSYMTDILSILVIRFKRSSLRYMAKLEC